MVLGGGLVDQLGGLELGDIVIDLNNIPVQSAEDLGALVALAEKNLHFLVKKTPEQDLKKFGIPNTPSLRRQISMKALMPEQKVLSHVRVRIFAILNYGFTKKSTCYKIFFSLHRHCLTTTHTMIIYVLAQRLV